MILVLVYVWVPFVALPIFVSLETLDRRLLEAAADLGASRWQAFRRVTLPLSMPGVFAAFLFVFIPTVGEFVTPSLVGGTSGLHVRQPDRRPVHDGFPDWQTGSVLALFLLLVVAALTVVFSRFLQVRQVTGGLMDIALSRNGRWVAAGVLLRSWSCSSTRRSCPAHLLVQRLASCRRSRSAGSRSHWYRDSARTPTSGRAARRARSSPRCRASARCARPPRVDGADTRRFRGKAAVSALLLSPLVIPYVVFGISLLIFFHALGIQRSIFTVVIGHIVISLPYTILVLVPRLDQIDAVSRRPHTTSARAACERSARSSCR